MQMSRNEDMRCHLKQAAAYAYAGALLLNMHSLCPWIKCTEYPEFRDWTAV